MLLFRIIYMISLEHHFWLNTLKSEHLFNVAAVDDFNCWLVGSLIYNYAINLKKNNNNKSKRKHNMWMFFCFFLKKSMYIKQVLK